MFVFGLGLQLCIGCPVLVWLHIHMVFVACALKKPIWDSLVGCFILTFACIGQCEEPSL